MFVLYLLFFNGSAVSTNYLAANAPPISEFPVPSPYSMAESTPAALVTIGAGTALASVVTAVPQLVWLSEHKIPLFAFAGLMPDAVRRFGLPQSQRAMSR
jgi:hypothetical protein